MKVAAAPLTPEAGVARRLRQHCVDRPSQIAVRQREGMTWQQCSYRELDQLVDRTCHALVRAGIQRGMRTVLMVPPGIEFLACTFALLRMGAPPVMVDPGMGIAGLGRCLEQARPEAFLGIPRAHRGRALLGWSRKSIQHRISVGPGWIPPFTSRLEHWRRRTEVAVPYPAPVLNCDETAAVLFTSGSTGPAKGAIAHHSLIENQVNALRDLHQIEAGEVDLPTFPLFGLFGVALGMTSTVPVMDFTRPAEADPSHLLDLIDQFQVTSLFASPALLGNLSRHLSSNRIQMPGLRRVISAGAPARHDEIESLLPSLSPDTSIYTPYGATEGLPLCCIDHQDLLTTVNESSRGNGICIGAPVSGIKIRITEINSPPTIDHQVAEGASGEIWASGPVVSRAYLNDEEANRFHKFRDPQGEHWHRTGDLGAFDRDGRVWFRGRLGQMVTTSRGDLHTVAIERVFDIHPAVKRTALVGLGASGSQLPVLCVEPREDHPFNKTTLIDELQTIGSTVPGADMIEQFCFPGPFPVDIRHNAKIDRKQLARSAAGRLR
ncbi:MAG: fatty acid CoA ligase family protein [Planctomycetota bacterium]|nr:fatty acid CoA ligase family protein [Planctomycetota bacterium]